MKMTTKMAYAIGQDAGNRNMRKASRTVWNQEDWNVASEITNRLLDTIEPYKSWPKGYDGTDRQIAEGRRL